MRQVCSISFRDVLAATGLLAEYAAECSIPLIGPIKPQPEIYEMLERGGVVKIFGGYVDGDLAGFGSLLMTVLPHYGRKTATVESLFVGQQYRDGGIGSDIMKAMEQHAKDAGCVVILYSAPAGSQLERILYLKKSYVRTNSVFCRSL